MTFAWESDVDFRYFSAFPFSRMGQGHGFNVKVDDYHCSMFTIRISLCNLYSLSHGLVDLFIELIFLLCKYNFESFIILFECEYLGILKNAFKNFVLIL